MMALAKTTKTLTTRLSECLREIFTSQQIPAKPLRIGVLILEEERFGKHGADAVKYLVLQLNCRQKMFQFEFLPVPEEDPLVRYLNKKAPVSDKYLDTEGRILDDKITEDEFGRFEGRNRLLFIKTSKSHKLEDKEPPHCYIFVTFCQLSSKAFGRSNENIGLLAFGDWKKHLAPPSILEFIVTILLRQAPF